ncbi:isoleucine-tRNA ligase [Coemansia sp. RSA 2322]|uniref:Isoleucine--tRNA ligase, mitochondrial n=1 Tax=Coemansia thaxteri TaxID=2663907 RepID=A0A9W8EE57_9FUNG|nr:isoleucine-tRNA ligase [Coemansia thaxteri]KAJ2470721.1 isoleucine-tRNA ligase [Coemansia sp. RSA 2322]
MNQAFAALRLSPATRSVGQASSVPARTLACSATRESKSAGLYAHTLKLPKTEFPLRADAARREERFRERCTDKLYKWQQDNNTGPQFILHDGPPYANGELHIGHFMNKVLKDIVNRYQVMQGRRVLYIPGFDAHGLPIEQKALAALKGRDHHSLDPAEIRRLARDFAMKAVASQTKSFRDYAIMGDWANRYLTLDPEYEARQLEVFKEMVVRGYIYRQNKPVYWSPSSRTALAEAELEYNADHVSTSVYVKFPLTSESVSKLGLAAGVSALAWTTTPWTLPANCAIAVHRDMDYALVRIAQEGLSDCQLLVGKSRLSAVAQLLPAGASVNIIRNFKGVELESLEYTSVLRNKVCRILLADYVTSESGSGLVHTAPGHGKEDYELGLANGIDVYSPVDDSGRFTSQAGAALEGKEVLGEGNAAVVEMLAERGALLARADVVHSYPYDWRTNRPIIQRATPQWFADVKDLKDIACKSIKDVVIVPESGRRRLESFVRGRSEWCISRQRVWGVPIPVLYSAQSGEPLLTAESIDHIIGVIRANGGTDAWWTLPVEALVLPRLLANGETFVKGTDTMDVWFDSGTSWKLLEERAEDRSQSAYADLYLEGSDQHRGWFQSSLLTSNAVRGTAPYKALVTHGFTLDEQGRKMAKSIGNTLAPSQVINGGKDKTKEPAYGVDLLRLVVGSTDYTQDVSFGSTIFAGFGDTIRKIRSTMRFMLGNLDGFTPEMAVPYDQMPAIDRYMLHELYHFKKAATTAFGSFEFFRAMQALNNFTNATLSAFYFDVCKDRLYAGCTASLERRSAQTVLRHILINYTTTLAPVTCHLAEEVWEFFAPVRSSFGSSTFSAFQEQWDQTDKTWDDPRLAEDWVALRKIRGLANRAIELARKSKAIGSSLEAELDIYVPSESRLGRLLRSHAEDLGQLCITSRASIHEPQTTTAASDGTFDHSDIVAAFGDETKVTVACRRSSLHKCPRCWNFHSAGVDKLCGRCDDVITRLQQ